MRFLKYLLERTYAGAAIEKGGTSIPAGGKVAPAVRDVLWKKGHIKAGQVVLDYGAGRNSRNADFLRRNGCEVYAYDPHFSKGSSGWDEGGVSNQKPPTDHFDVGFSCFVLNVVPESVEDEIISNVRKSSKKQFHITRNMDIFKTAKNALNKKGNKWMSKFFLEVFAENEKDIYDYENGNLSDERIMDFCLFGHQTAKEKFQRIPELEKKGFSLIKKQEGFKVYKK